MTITRQAAARARREGMTQRSSKPPERRWGSDLRSAPSSPLRASARATAPVTASLSVERSAATAEAAATTLRGYASTYEQDYEMWDAFGPYTEVVTAGAGSRSLKTSPDVVFLFNHRGMPMARTHGAETLELSEEDYGLLSVAHPEMRLPDSQTLVTAIDAKLITEMSFAFVIERGVWSPDYTQYRIDQYDIDRGDTSAVTYGANPTTEIVAERSAEMAARMRRVRMADLARRSTVTPVHASA